MDANFPCSARRQECSPCTARRKECPLVAHDVRSALLYRTTSGVLPCTARRQECSLVPHDVRSAPLVPHDVRGAPLLAPRREECPSPIFFRHPSTFQLPAPTHTPLAANSVTLDFIYSRSKPKPRPKAAAGQRSSQLVPKSSRSVIFPLAKFMCRL